MYDSTSLGLIKASLQCKDITWHGYAFSILLYFCLVSFVTLERIGTCYFSLRTTVHYEY